MNRDDRLYKPCCSLGNFVPDPMRSAKRLLGRFLGTLNRSLLPPGNGYGPVEMAGLRVNSEILPNSNRIGVRLCGLLPAAGLAKEKT